MTVEPDLTLPGHPEVFALGDMVRVRGRDGSPITLPGVAPVAMQEGRYAAKAVRARLQGRAAPPFRYRDKGNPATIGRAAAVADINGIKLNGFLAWMTWAGRAPLLPGRHAEPAPSRHPLVVQLHDARPAAPG